jgi:hypothetical protein
MENCRWVSEVNGRTLMKCTSPARVIARDRVTEIDMFYLKCSVMRSHAGPPLESA